MSDCNKIVIDVYNHPDLLRLISKIKPESIRDDLRQEIAVSLLEQPCIKIAALFADDNLLRYTMKICWLMATSKTSGFYYKYKKNDILKAVEYLRSTQVLPTLPESLAITAVKHLKQKNQTIYDDHEARLFNKYVELGSCRAVARYYGIPINHCCNIIAKVKTELKCLLLR
jgi:hypothetical protein